MNKNILIAIGGVVAVILLGIILYFFFIAGPASGSAVRAVEAATGKPIPNTEITISYQCKDSLGGATVCSLPVAKTNAEGVAFVTGKFSSNLAYIASARYKAEGKTYLGNTLFNFKRDEEMVVPVFGPETLQFCVAEPFHFEEDAVRVASYTQESKDQIRLNLDLGFDTTIKITDIEITGFGKASKDQISSGLGLVRANPLLEREKGCFSYPVKISYEYSGLDIKGVSEGTISGAFWW